MSELKKLETTGYSSKLDEIAKNDTEVFLKVKLSGRRTFGEYEFEPKNGFAVHFGNHIDVLDLDKCDVYQLDQPQLNENQQKWINRLTINYSWYGGTAQHALHATLQEPEMPDLPQNEFAQVLEVFSKWVQEQGEE